MGGFGYMTFSVFLGIPVLVLGIMGSLIDNREARGTLLLIAAFLFLSGFFGISFVLLLPAGIFALTKRN